MHEYSVVQSFIELCEDYVKENQCQRVLEAKVKVGILSGIELGLFQRALETFKVGSVLGDAKIEYVIQPLVLKCQDCNRITQTQKHHVQCLQCGSVEVKILEGEEMTLLHLEME
ncbi:hydrogenase maturation nickel metallochaperone HypA [Helicobacter cholecystus]|uniref:Hydrogenase maturation factor HypA n=1 Tax=Helicobacter cholecystus TaxID=45498 RepID=A0A3D8IX72_9HELI|nr:hydrogenase maturation nickel metallochaperone HypA [Helicobacter cholecystus]RDU69566.1 hydrogenase maturation nickel metallochaperone HypA [Helicobacter cholecystus]VEJ24122.1 hydrogenase expression /formation protein [Helicobacter cholecystus]